mmetsp:Transcript_28787/g.86393  ORF Transcript_28787/g.86393 Transcript_28787/m.86393 type:complete len:1227 (-) Transcript_28787:2817-6497(-)
MPLTAEQRKRAEANKARAMALKAAKMKTKQSSMLSFFSPVAAAQKKDAEGKPAVKSTTPMARGMPTRAAMPIEVPPPNKKLFFKESPDSKADDMSELPAEPPAAPLGTSPRKRKGAAAAATPAAANQSGTPSCSPPGSTAPPPSGLGGPSRRRAARPASYAVDLATDDDGTDDDEVARVVKRPSKRLRRVVDSDSEGEYRPDPAEAAAVAADEEAADAAMELEPKFPEADSDDEPLAVAYKSRRASPSTRTPRPVPAPSSSGGSRLTATTAVTRLANKPSRRDAVLAQPMEDRYEWLKDIRDAAGVRVGQPGHDPSTLWMPPRGPKGWTRKVGRDTKPLTDFENQYWSIKCKFWDTVLFFKKGKFYELYEKDADIGHKELGLKLTDRVNMRMAGVPEKSFPEWAGKLIGLGYKVAKADEKESGLAKQMREKKGKKSGSKIIERNLTAVFTQGTLSGDFLVGDHSRYILSIRESAEHPRRFGVCFVDVGTAEINLSQIDDDAALTQLETLLVQIKPQELVFPKGGLQQATRRLLKIHCAGVSVKHLKLGEDFWSDEYTLDEIEREGYFRKDGSPAGRDSWPSELRAAVGQSEVISALGGLISYFRALLMDKSVISQGRFQRYDPLRDGGTLMLDGQTLQNLEVLENGIDSGTAGTVLELLCHCSSGFGKRLFRKWVCHPLRAAADIEARFSVIDELSAKPELCDTLRDLLRRLPDLERSVSLIHVGTCKVKQFIETIDAFEMVWRVFHSELQPRLESLESPALKRLLTIGNRLPQLREHLEFFGQAFDRDAARETGVIEPARGMVAEFDDNADDIDRIETELDQLIRQYRRDFGLPKLQFYHPGVSKEQYQIAVPVDKVKRVPESWRYLSAVKSFKRYWSPEVESLQDPLAMAKETKRQLLRDSLSTFLAKFDEASGVWSAVTQCLAELDCLLSLAAAKEVMGEPMCKPTIVDDGSPVLSVKELRHPCLEHSGAVQDYIPNDTHLGGDSATAVVLTGPNMGGKSTLLRQTCIAVIMAQLGAHVPAESMELTPVDRIFTRIGANDNIIAGRSTFMVELKETATILNHATDHSLVILDELGRGTATFDGTAIAYATLKHLLERVRCRTMFATHYHSLTDDFSTHSAVSLEHMACRVEENRRDVTFLYQLERGVCSKSYGLNVANMAGLPSAIVDYAEKKAAELETSCHGAGTVGLDARDASVVRQLCSLLDAEPAPAADEYQPALSLWS